jgi:hypothetical protein
MGVISGRSLKYCVKFLNPLRGKCGNFLGRPRIRLRLGYGVTGYPDVTDRCGVPVPATPKLSKGGSAALENMQAARPFDFAQGRLCRYRITLARGRRRFFRSTARRAARPTMASVLIRRS